MKEESLFDGWEKSVEITNERAGEVLYSSWERRLFSRVLLGDFASNYKIYKEDSACIVLITKEKLDYETELEVEVNDFETRKFYKTKESLYNKTKKVWDSHIENAIKERDDSLCRIEELQ